MHPYGLSVNKQGLGQNYPKAKKTKTWPARYDITVAAFPVGPHFGISVIAKNQQSSLEKPAWVHLTAGGAMPAVQRTQHPQSTEQ